MRIQYKCRHCKTEIGHIDKEQIETEQLGFQFLSNEEREDMIHYEGDNIIVEAICEDCYEALNRNPDYHTLHNFLQ